MRPSRSVAGSATILLSLAFFVGVLACSGCTSREKKFAWSKSEASASDLEKARAECTKRAEEETAGTRQDWPAVHSMINIFLECMKQKGWELDEEDDD